MSKEVLNDPNRINPFQFANDICGGGRSDYPKTIVERFYEPWMITRIMSLYIDTVLQANQLNTSHVPPEEKYAQYKYFCNSVTPKKRFAKWVKKTADEDVTLVQEYYNCGYAEALEYVKLLNLEQLAELKAQVSKGGRKQNE